MDSEPEFQLDNSYARELPELSLDWQPAQVPEPSMVVLNSELAFELGFDPEFLDAPPGEAFLSGNATLDETTPVALAYAGHQFGGYSPRLGDGRAVLLTEIVDAAGERFDLHLKGSGRTPFARGGDGKAELGPMLREFLIAEAMHALGIPTTRALSVVATGEDIRRESGAVPGAVLARIAASHIRVGTFEYAARLPDSDEGSSVLERLVDYSIKRHHPDAEGPLGLLEAVVITQAELIAKWMLVGFIHGVMNTDNMTISGESIDYGPCAFMDRYDPATVYSSIDTGGRYAYGNQPKIGQWDLARFAETLLPLIDEDIDTAASLATDVLNKFGPAYERAWLFGMGTKLGIGAVEDADADLFSELLDLMQIDRVDYTSTFRNLSDGLRGDESAFVDLFTNTDAASAWFAAWKERLGNADPKSVGSSMDLVNPVYIPRNHLVDEALVAATNGDHGPFQQLLMLVTEPYELVPDTQRLTAPAPAEWDAQFKTYCGT